MIEALGCEIAGSGPTDNMPRVDPPKNEFVPAIYTHPELTQRWSEFGRTR